MLQLRIGPAALAALLFTLGAGPASAASCVGAEPLICPLGTPSGQDCRIDADCTVPSSDPYPVWDFGARRLVVTRTITVTGDGILPVAAAGVVLGSSATIRAAGDGRGGQRVALVATGDVTIERRAVIDVSSAAGTLESFGAAGGIEVSGATVRVAGKLVASGDGRDTYGGSVYVDATGDLDVAFVDVKGGDRAGGGDVTLYAGGTLTASEPIRCQGLDGGSVTLEAGADVVTLPDAEILVQATGPDGAGGSVDVYAGASVTIGGAISGWGQEGIHEDGRADTGGDGADVTVEALLGSVAITANLDLGGAPSGYGGNLEVSADADVTLAGNVLLDAGGPSGSGSIATDVSAGGNLTISGAVDASSMGSGGELLFFAGGTVAITSTARISVDGPGDPDIGGAGYTTVEGECAVQIASGALLSAMGSGDSPYASHDVRASHLTIGGTLRAGSENYLAYRTIDLLPTADLIPAAPLPPPSASAPCCGGCPTTTTTAPPTTSTTLTIPTTTSTSTTKPPATTTTLPPPTTTTTPPTTTTSPTTPSSTSTTVTTSTLASTTSTSDAPDTSPTTTTASPIPTTTVAASTTTTAAQPPSTTSTTVPPPGSECVQQPSGAAAASCRIGTLSETLGVTPPDALGGRATARRLAVLLGRANRFLDLAERGKKARLNLRKARRQLKSFEKQVQRGLARSRGPIDAQLGRFILALAKDAASDVGVMQAALQ